MSGPAPIAVVGATGTGKSELALDLAERCGGEVVNCDAMQQYRGMDIGTAKLAPEQRRGIPHHRLDVLDVRQTASVADFRAEAEREIAEIRGRGNVPILCGGSMMYVQALIDGWTIPDTDPRVRAHYEQRLAVLGVAGLHAELARVDPEAARIILPTDPRRTVRALEVVHLTEHPGTPPGTPSGSPGGVPGCSACVARCPNSTNGWLLEQLACSLTDWWTSCVGSSASGCSRGSPPGAPSGTPRSLTRWTTSSRWMTRASLAPGNAP